MSPRHTIRPGSLDATIQVADLIGRQTTVAAETTSDASAPLSHRLVLGAVIGEGGMGIVRAATQTSLGREVAVKTLRAGGMDHAARLLREAWITGALEHPNIVPIHDLGSDEERKPMLVLKRIEGRPWSELLDNAAEIRAAFGMDALEWNIQQLVSVCHAISFAHSRGIVHRDLKPANVMIGRFGEVYVLDWGIAVSLVDDKSGRFPLASESRDLAGTPVYMAPEMLGDTPATERTDVYLLGAILFEIMTGQPPHMTESIVLTLERIKASEPTYPAHAPNELALICRRAMARDPSERFATADALRVALLGFLEHRGSAAIAGEALTQLERLLVSLRATEFDRVTAYQQFGQCRFGFESALRSWPDNAIARTGLDRALVAMATRELDQGDARAASVLLAELRDPPPELTSRLANLERDVAEKARHVEALERLGADQDASFGSRTRTLFLVFVGLTWSMMPLAAGLGLFPSVELDHRASLVISGVSLASVIVAAWLARKSMMRTAFNRGVIVTVGLFLVLHSALEAEAWALHLDMVRTQPISIALWAGICGTAAIFLDRALLFPTLAFLVALGTCVISPAQRFWAIAASAGVLLTTVVYIWQQGRSGRRPIMGLADRLKSHANAQP